MGYNGITLGPIIILKQGEVVLLELENKLDKPTVLHVHGLSNPNSQDGMPEIEPTPKIKPGHSFTYQFSAWQSGTFFYHSSNPEQESNGLINNSNQSHTMHIHGHDFNVVGEDAFLRKGKMMDTINVASGKRFDIDFTANNPGNWPVNGTKPFHKTNNGISPGGMLTQLKYLR